MEKFYFIEWHINGSKAPIFSPNSFPLDRAEELVKIANEHFKRAEHKVSVEDFSQHFIHPKYQEGGDLLNGL